MPARAELQLTQKLLDRSLVLTGAAKSLSQHSPSNETGSNLKWKTATEAPGGMPSPLHPGLGLLL